MKYYLIILTAITIGLIVLVGQKDTSNGAVLQPIVNNTAVVKSPTKKIRNAQLRGRENIKTYIKRSILNGEIPVIKENERELALQAYSEIYSEVVKTPTKDKNMWNEIRREAPKRGLLVKGVKYERK